MGLTVRKIFKADQLNDILSFDVYFAANNADNRQQIPFQCNLFNVSIF